MQTFVKLPQIEGLRSIVKVCPDSRTRTQQTFGGPLNRKILYPLPNLIDL